MMMMIINSYHKSAGVWRIQGNILRQNICYIRWQVNLPFGQRPIMHTTDVTLYGGHSVRRQGARLVRTNGGSIAQCFTGIDMSNQIVILHHLLLNQIKYLLLLLLLLSLLLLLLIIIHWIKIKWNGNLGIIHLFLNAH